jgi:heme-degrading monooxygenase HmoA
MPITDAVFSSSRGKLATTIRPAPSKEVDNMIIQFVKFKSQLSRDQAEKIMKERAPKFRAIPGLIQKFYGVEKDTGELTGIYFWDSEESIQEFRKSELARTIPEAYKAASTPGFEFFDVMYTLRS